MGRLGSFHGVVLSLGRELSEEGVSPGVFSHSFSFALATPEKCSYCWPASPRAIVFRL